MFGRIGWVIKMSDVGAPERSRSPEIRVVLAGTVGDDLADRIITGSCNILSLDESELHGQNLDRFMRRMEIVVPDLVGLKAGQVILKRLWGLMG